MVATAKMARDRDRALAFETEMRAAIAHAADGVDDALDWLLEYLAIPSISAQSAHAADVQRAVEFFQEGMKKAGLQNVRQVFPVKGRPALLLGEWLGAQGAKTILFYGHGDVQPEGDLAKWTLTQPFVPTVTSDGNIVARGSCDDKGQIAVVLRAVGACLAANGKLPVNVKFLIEHEEEHGSVAVTQFVRDPANRDWLRADAALICDSEMAGLNDPGHSVSLRGLVYKEVVVGGPAGNLHSGQYGGAVENPGNVLCEIVAALRERGTHRVRIPGFYDGIPATRDPRFLEAATRFADDPAVILKETGVPKLLHDSPGEMTWAKGLEPTLDVNGILSGYTGEGASTVIPASASCKVSMRLVWSQDPTTISNAFDAYVRSLVPDTVRVEILTHHMGRPWVIDLDHPVVKVASEAMAATFGKPSKPIFCGGSIPIVLLLKEVLGLDTALLGLSTPGSNLHGPNEIFPLEHFRKGPEAVIRFFYGLAA